MAAPVLGEEYRQALLFLGTAGIVVPLFRRLKISPVIGFMVAGMAIGPFALGRLGQSFPALAAFTLTDVPELLHLSEIGVLFLLFLIGLELSFDRLMRMKKLVFGLGLVQFAISSLAMWAAARWFGLSSAQAAVIGGALALSSTAIVIPVLAEMRRLGTHAGRGAFSILLLQDIMVAPLLFMVAMLDPGRPVTPTGLGILYAVLPAFLVLALVVGVGRLVLRPIFRQVAQAGSTEFFVAACLLVVLGTSLLTAAGGLSMALGAFIAGLLLAETEFRREIEVTIEPFKGLLLGLFFMSIGAGLDLSRVWEAPAATLGTAAGIIIVKSAITFVAARLFGFSLRRAAEIALLIGPGGEFAFIMMVSAMGNGLLPAEAGSHIMLSVTLTMIMIPLLALAGRAVNARAPAPVAAQEPPPGDDVARVIIVGFGRVGKVVASLLKHHDIPYLAIDDDSRLVAALRSEGQPVFWGDAGRRAFLQACGIEKARALVVTVNNATTVHDIVTIARELRADLTIVARARDADQARALYEIGATDAIPETVEASLQLCEAVLVDIGVPMGFVIASIHEKRDEYRALLQPSGESEASRPRRAIKMSTRVKDMGKPKAKPETKAEPAE